MKTGNEQFPDFLSAFFKIDANDVVENNFLSLFVFTSHLVIFISYFVSRVNIMQIAIDMNSEW
jgi:hypothetical protein